MRVASTALALIVLAAPATARAAEVYTLAGRGSQELRDGGLPGRARPLQVTDVAPDPRGGYAFAERGRLWHVAPDGRLKRIATPRGQFFDAVVYAADGSLYAGGADHAVWRLAPAQIVAGHPRKAGYSGDGGPATAARLTRPLPLEFDAGGGLLIADEGRIRRLAPDGTISTLAVLETVPDALVQDIAASPDGRVYATSHRGVTRIDPDGTVTPLGPAAEALAVDAGGTLITGHDAESTADRWIVRYGPPAVTLARWRDLAGFDVWRDQDLLGDIRIATDAIEPTADGGLLIVARSAIHYLAPPAPALSAVAITSARRIEPNRVRVNTSLTTPARVRVKLWRGGRLLARAETPTPRRAATLTLHARVDPAIHRLTAEAIPDGAALPAAAAHTNALLAPVLPVAVARDLIDAQAELLAALDEMYLKVGRCQRLGPRRVDCPATSRRSCAGVLSVVWLRDGRLAWTIYGARRGPCRIAKDRGRKPPARRRPPPERSAS